jgi:hypothetical protein
VRPTPTTTASTLRPAPRRTGLVHRRQPGSDQGSRELAVGRTGSSVLPFTGTSVTLPLLLLAVTLVLGGGLALRRGRIRYRPTHLRR